MHAQASAAQPSLHDLKSAHENLTAWMWALDDLTLEQEPKLGRLETVRWFLGKARRDRRVLVEQVYTSLLPRLSGQSASDVANARALTLESLAVGSEHIATWNREAVAANWSDYCEATRKVRDLWLRAIEAEQRVLYPLLDRQQQRDQLHLSETA